jgi:hypothetical protein
MIDWLSKEEKKKTEECIFYERKCIRKRLKSWIFLFCDVTMYCNTVIAFENKTHLETEELAIEVYKSTVKRDQAYFVCCEKNIFKCFV